MAYFKVDNKDGEQYLRIMQSHRVDGKVVKKTLYSLGKVSDYTPAMLRRMGERLYVLGGGELKELLGEDTEEMKRVNYGYYQACTRALKFYGLDRTLQHLERRRKIQYSVYQCVLLMLIERLHCPDSKRGNYNNQSEYWGIEPICLHHLYRSLDLLSDHAQHIQNTIYKTGRDLFNQKLDVVFYDVTTFYFHSDREDELRTKGFSKDGKQGKVQIVFGLLIDKHKQPVGYQIYKGNYFEGKTFLDVIARLKDTYHIDKIIVVADRGMLNKTNIDLTEDNGYEFIMGERLKGLPHKVKNYLIDQSNYKSEWIYNRNDQEVRVKYCLTQYKGRTIIGTWSKKRADKDKADREELLAKANKLLDNPSQLSRKAQRFFIKDEGQHQYKLNEDKIQQAEKYDGYLAISTNNSELSIDQVLDHYRHLYQIEHSFRTFKSHLETRPMFHWTQKRIEGHICLCYISYTIHNYLRQKLKKANVKLSDKALRKALDGMQMSLIQSKGKQFYIRSNNKDPIPALINKLGLPKIPNIIAKELIINYL